MNESGGIQRGDYVRLITGSVVLIAGAVAGIMVLNGGNLEKVGIFGIIILFTVLIGNNLLSGSVDLSTAEVRRAISISIVSVFFALLGRADKISVDKGLIVPLIDKFWWIIVTVIVFYFGSRTLEILKRN